MKRYRLGILGAGNMGMAIARGAVNTGICAAHETLLFNRTEEKRVQNSNLGFAVTGDFTELYASCQTVVLGIKPQNFAELLPRLSDVPLTDKPLVVSIAAGITFATMEAALGSDTPIIRVMPNTPLMIGEGACALTKNAAATEEQLTRIRTLFDGMGMTVVFDREEMLSEVIPYNGSAPAYVYAFIEGMVKSAQAHGISYDDAMLLFCTTMIGAAKLARSGEKTPQELIRQVCSPGGTTIEAVKVLEDRDLQGILAEASDKCIARAYELGK